MTTIGRGWTNFTKFVQNAVALGALYSTRVRSTPTFLSRRAEPIPKPQVPSGECITYFSYRFAWFLPTSKQIVRGHLITCCVNTHHSEKMRRGPFGGEVTLRRELRCGYPKERHCSTCYRTTGLSPLELNQVFLC